MGLGAERLIAVETVVVLAAPQLLISLAATSFESQRRARLGESQRSSAQGLQFGGEVLNWLLVLSMLALSWRDRISSWEIGCVDSWLWALVPFWGTMLLLMLHQLYLLGLWRWLRPRRAWLGLGLGLGLANPIPIPILTQTLTQTLTLIQTLTLTRTLTLAQACEGSRGRSGPHLRPDLHPISRATCRRDAAGYRLC